MLNQRLETVIPEDCFFPVLWRVFKRLGAYSKSSMLLWQPYVVCQRNSFVETTWC